MPCEAWRARAEQTLAERKEEIKEATTILDKLIMQKKVKVVVGKQGAVTFVGDAWARNRRGITDACAYRRLVTTGSVLTRTEISRAETLAGVKIDQKVVAQGVHSHDGGASWHAKG
jgi:MoxR-like ATPase